jgi:hypothetical protein
VIEQSDATPHQGNDKKPTGGNASLVRDKVATAWITPNSNNEQCATAEIEKHKIE